MCVRRYWWRVKIQHPKTSQLNEKWGWEEGKSGAWVGPLSAVWREMRGGLSARKTLTTLLLRFCFCNQFNAQHPFATCLFMLSKFICSAPSRFVNSTYITTRTKPRRVPSVASTAVSNSFHNPMLCFHFCECLYACVHFSFLFVKFDYDTLFNCTLQRNFCSLFLF